MLETFEKMLASGKDSAMLRFSLGSELFKRGEFSAAAVHLERAVELDPVYSAAWKLLGRAREMAGERQAAVEAYERGLVVAQSRGDQQAAREMAVFLRRLGNP